jgi:integrase
LALRWSDVDLDAWIIHITRTVSGKGYGPPKSKNGVRKIPLSEGTVKMLSKHKVQQGKEKLLFGEGYNPENLVFCKENGKRLPYEDARYFFECFCKHAELPYIKPHGLRHTHATMLLMNGHSVNAVAERLGDDPETIMKTYAHVLPGMQKEMVKTIEQLYDDEISK